MSRQKSIKTITMYLPQFHTIKENDEWWGKGFTEWTAVKAAKPLYEGHKQPKVPLNENYYNLLEKETLNAQAQLMQKYGIDGQCFYHYYFKNGRKILEKPAENLLKWKEINMPFCFCWANESWIKTWSALAGNSWADMFEKGEEGSGILLEQRYGREREWKAHFEYLLPFFEDDRYIKIEGHPVFLIYKPTEIPCLRPMIDYWRELAQSTSFENIYFIGMNIVSAFQGLDAVLFVPALFWESNVMKNGLYQADYYKIWTNIIEASPLDECKTYFEGIVNFDNTPRKGQNGGRVFENFSIDTFKNGMCELYKKSISLKNELIFINAWNEWGEGMYLEPDEENGFSYLEAVKEAKQDAMKNSESFVLLNKENVGAPGAVRTWAEKLKKNQLMVNCFDSWLDILEQGKSIGDFLIKNDVKTVAVYGMGILGRHLLKELEKESIQVKYVIDQKKQVYHQDYDIKSIDDELPEVDAVIITPLGDFDKIYSTLKQRVNYRLFSIMELTNEIEF